MFTVKMHSDTIYVCAHITGDTGKPTFWTVFDIFFQKI